MSLEPQVQITPHCSEEVLNGPKKRRVRVRCYPEQELRRGTGAVVRKGGWNTGRYSSKGSKVRTKEVKLLSNRVINMISLPIPGQCP